MKRRAQALAVCCAAAAQGRSPRRTAADPGWQAGRMTRVGPCGAPCGPYVVPCASSRGRPARMTVRTGATVPADARLYLCTDARERQGDLPSSWTGPGRRRRHRPAARQGHGGGRGAGAPRRSSPTPAAATAELLAVNDRADVAHAAGADVLHLGQGDLPVPAARAILGDRVADRPLHPRRGRGGRGRRRARRGLLLHRAGAGRPPPSPAATRPASTWSGTPAALGTDRARGSPSAASTSATSTRCWTPGARRVVVVRAITEAADPGRRPPSSRSGRSAHALGRSRSPILSFCELRARTERQIWTIRR